MYKIKRYWPFLILVICSSSNGQTKSSAPRVTTAKQQIRLEPNKEKEEERLLQELHFFLPKFKWQYEKESNFHKNVNIIYRTPNNPYHNFLVKSGKMWAGFTAKYYLNDNSNTIFFWETPEFIEIKSDNLYFYISKISPKEINPPSLQKKLPDEDEEVIVQDLPLIESTSQEQFFDNLGAGDGEFSGVISKQFKGYKNIYRIPKIGGWAQEISLKSNNQGIIIEPREEKWSNSFKLNIIRKQ